MNTQVHSFLKDDNECRFSNAILELLLKMR